MNILFCKIYDEINTGPDETVTFRCGVHENRDQVKRRIIDLFEKKVKREYGDVFTQADQITLDSDSLVYVVGELQNYCITEAERDAIGEAFEVFIGPSLKGAEGQFFTPRNVVRLAVGVLNPKPGEMIIDPACGSGGFLIVALEYVWKKIEEHGKRRKLSKSWIADEQQKIANRCFRGIDKDSFLAKVTKAYMAIVRDGRGGIFCENTLSPPSEWARNAQEKVPLNGFDIIMTNPPFGAKIPIRGEHILKQYDNLAACRRTLS
jgi:type I restriction enzyme M protein